MIKFFILLVISFSFVSCVEKQAEVKSAESVSVQTQKTEEDCDDKAKEKIEIKEDTISLSNSTGCTLEE